MAAKAESLPDDTDFRKLKDAVGVLEGHRQVFVNGIWIIAEQDSAHKTGV